MMCGHNFSKGPMKPGCRRTLVRGIYRIFVSFYIFTAGLWTSKVYQECDYTYYLGPDYKKNYRAIEKTSTKVCNHTSWLDAPILIKYFCPGFTPKDMFKGMPLFGKLCDISESIYMPKGGSKESSEEAMKIISDRQELIEKTGKLTPICIFPEGMTSNGTGILNFRRGAFNGLKRISPTILKYR